MGQARRLRGCRFFEAAQNRLENRGELFPNAIRRRSCPIRSIGYAEDFNLPVTDQFGREVSLLDEFKHT